MWLELSFRLVSAVAVSAAAVLTTVSWRKWAHRLIRPGMAYSTFVLWAVSIYRWWLFLFRIEPDTEPAQFIRLFLNVIFVAIAIGFAIHAYATREFYQRHYKIYAEGPDNVGR